MCFIRKVIILTILLCSFNSINVTAQNQKTNKTIEKQHLKGLTKASLIDLSEKQINLDGETFPVYNYKGERIRGMKMLEAMTSGKYTPNFYLDNNKEIKAAVLEIATKEEKITVKEMKPQINGKSELIGKDAIPFTIKDIKGEEYSLNNLKGKIIVMNFWFVECKPCVQEIPELNELVKNYKNKDVVFLGFATNDKSKIESFLKKKDFSYNIIPSSKKIAKDYNVSGYPTHIIINENSKIIYTATGLDANTISDVKKTIESLIQN